MYLTKLEMPLHSRWAAGALSDCQRMHRLVSGLFGDGRQEQNVLYRVRTLRGAVQLYIYSAIPPAHIPEEVSVAGQRDLTSWLEELREEQYWGFDLLTMPFKKVSRAEPGKRSQRRILREPEERLQWLRRKGEQNGFAVVEVQELEQTKVQGRHPQEQGGAMYWDVIHYQGVLQITDAQRFRSAVETGIGPGKAYGLGMLLLQRR